MATKRNRKSRKVRKSRRGSGLIFDKTEDDNVRNCKNVWHPKDPQACNFRVEGTGRRRTEIFDYPGRFHFKKPVTVKTGVNIAPYYSGKIVPEGQY